MLVNVIRRLVFGAALGLTVAGLLPAREVQAQSQSCVDSCDEDFPGGDPFTIGARGWCMIIRCLILEP